MSNRNVRRISMELVEVKKKILCTEKFVEIYWNNKMYRM